MNIHRADALDLLDHVQPGTAQACVTSPPYLQQRRYGDDPREGGAETTLEHYVAWLATALNRVRCALRPDGLLWLNIGDKANGSGGAGGDWNPARKRRATGGGPAKFSDPAYLDGGFLDVPGAVLRQLLHDGWRLRMTIVWDKGRQAPEDLTHVGRPRSQHEMIYMLAPSPARPRFYPSGLVETGSVWSFPPGGQGDPHLAPFPDELARRCILPSTLPGDLVIDPFAGSGTVPRVAEQLGRRAIGTDLYAGSDIAPKTLAADVTPSDPVAKQEHPQLTTTAVAAVGWRNIADFYFAQRTLAAALHQGQALDVAIAHTRHVVGEQRVRIDDTQLLHLLERTVRDANHQLEALR